MKKASALPDSKAAADAPVFLLFYNAFQKNFSKTTGFR